MNVYLFKKISQTLKQQFPEASHEFLLEQTHQMYEAEMQRRSRLTSDEQAFAEAEDILDVQEET